MFDDVHELAPIGPQAQQAPSATARKLRPLITAASVVTMFIGAVALAGWILNLPQLKSVVPGAVEMKANTALALIAAGCALQLLAAGRTAASVRLGAGLAAAVSLLGLATLSQSLFGWRLGIDELLFADKAGSYNVIRGRMSPYSAVAFSTIGIALLAVRRAGLSLLVYPAAGVTLVIGTVSAIGYGWNASELTTDIVLPPVAVNTAIAFIFLAGGTLTAVAQRRLQRTRRTVRHFAMTAIETRILVGFAGSFLLLVVGGGLSYKSGVDFANSAKWVAHTHQVRATLSRLHGDLSTAGWAQRNYLVTGHPEQYDRYQALISKVNGQLSELRVLVGDSAQQAASVAALQPLTEDVHRFLDNGIQAFQRSGFEEAQKVVNQGTGVRSMEAVYSIINRMQAVEEDLLVQREATELGLQRYMLASMLMTLLIAACLFGFLFYGIRRQMQARQEAEENLHRARNAALLARHEADLANRAKSAFLAAMSHEIRTPMNGVLGLLELLSLTPLDGDQVSTLTVATESGRSLLRIVDDILDFSKIEANHMDLSPEPASVADLVNRICDIHSGKASSQGLLLRAVIGPNISPCLHFDPLRMEQILNNFVSNALKFTRRGSVHVRVELTSATDGKDALCFTVADTGIGVTPENLERLFQPFMQADTTTTNRLGGTGLGLVICRRLAELMGGTVEMRSEVGQGTTITLRVAFPRGTPEELAGISRRTARERLDGVLSQRRPAPSIEQAEAEGTLVLVVDDHPTNRMVMRRQLGSLGYAAETASDGLLAFEAWKTGRFAAIVADCNMPVMSGYEMSRAIRADEQATGAKRVPIFACTANALDTEAAVCIEAGMDDYLVKPVDLGQLAKRLDRWLPLPSATPVTAVLDEEQLAAASFGDADMQAEILADFRRINDEDVLMLRRAVDAKAFEDITHYCHRISGGCAMIGAVDLAQVCRDMELASRSKDLVKVTSAFADFNREMARLTAHLDGLAPTVGASDVALN